MTELQYQIASLLVNATEGWHTYTKLSFAGVYHQIDLSPQEVARAFTDMLNKGWIERQDENGEILYGITMPGVQLWDNYRDLGPRWYYTNLRPF